MNSIGAIIAQNRKKLKMTQPELSSRLAERGINISYKTISGWEKGLAEPGAMTFLEVCRILEVSDIYEAIFGENPFNRASKLNNKGKEKLDDFLDLLFDSHKYEKNDPEIIDITSRRIKLFDTRVSAGTGNFLYGDSYEWIEAGDEVPKKTDFALRITGDSMEPRYLDRSIVWVQQRDSLTSGNIGIFLLNGDAYCKKYQEKDNQVVLISLNKKYPPIQVNENDEFKIFGKVLN